jgi:hypothetical protein
MINIILIVGLILSYFQPTKEDCQKTNLETSMINSEKTSHLLYEGKLVSVQVDKTLYETDNSDYFYIRFEIKNISDKIIGINLNDSWKILYPNQWGMYDTTYRMVVNEEQIIPDKLDSLKKQNLITDFKNRKLKQLAPNKSFIYYTEFNANGRSKIEKEIEKGNFFIQTIDGQLFLTDGNECERIVCDGSIKVQRELVLQKPLKWEKIKNKELIIQRN